MQEHRQVPAGKAYLTVARGDGGGDTGCGCQNGCSLGPAKILSGALARKPT